MGLSSEWTPLALGTDKGTDPGIFGKSTSVTFHVTGRRLFEEVVEFLLVEQEGGGRRNPSTCSGPVSV